jgi:hypothetical protein
VRIPELVVRLDGVRGRGHGHWIARCPAHDDRHPSLSISEGDRGLLLRCWAGCSLEAVCQALGIAVRDLFYDRRPQAAHWRDIKGQRELQRANEEAINYVVDLFIDLAREAERLIASSHGHDISTWSAEQLDEALNLLAEAYAIVEREQYAEEWAGSL